MSYAWDQCDNCGKLGSALSLNELGLCPECAADDDIVAAKEEELIEDEDPSCPRCGVRFNVDDWFAPLTCPVCGQEIAQ